MTSTLAAAPWRVFTVEVRALRRLGPSFLRVTFAGPDLDRFADNGYDQRIKLALPAAEGASAELPAGPDWYQRWRDLPAERRSPIRTYTVRAVRPGSASATSSAISPGVSAEASSSRNPQRA